MVEKRWGNMVLDRGKAASNAMILSVFPNQGHNGASHKRKKKKLGNRFVFRFSDPFIASLLLVFVCAR